MESFAKKILNGYLGMYIEGLDSLDISNISDFTLTDLRLRKDILDEFALPVVVHAGLFYVTFFLLCYWKCFKFFLFI